MLKHNLLKKLQFFLRSQADVMGFFSRSFPVACSCLAAFARSCSYTICCSSLWTLPVLSYFILCALLAVKMPALPALRLPEGAEGCTSLRGHQDTPKGAFSLLLRSTRPQQSGSVLLKTTKQAEVCGGSCLTCGV